MSHPVAPSCTVFVRQRCFRHPAPTPCPRFITRVRNSARRGLCPLDSFERPARDGDAASKGASRLFRGLNGRH